MSFAQWVRPHHVLVIFLCIMLIFGGTLGWLAWQLLEQDRSLERQRVQERLEQAADQIAAALQHSHSDLEAYLSWSPGPGVKGPPDGVVIFQAAGHAVSAYPPGCLLYYPMIPGEEEPPAGTFVEGENLEFQRNDPAKAAEVFRALARPSKPVVRAGALLRLGRNLRKAGRNEEALQVYGELAQLGPVPLMGLPAELVAQEARCSVLEAMGKREELRQEASLMVAALQSGRWRLLHPAWEFHMSEARRWAVETELTERQRNALVLSRAAEWIYDQWPAGLEPKGRRVVRLEARPALIAWTATADRLASVLCPLYLLA